MSKLTYAAIEAVNKELKSIPLKGKNYVQVKDKISGFRVLMPNGGVDTKIEHLDDKRIVISAKVYDDAGALLGSGIAEELFGSSGVNKTSAVENCETSAIGRALASLGIGVEDSYASANEVLGAINNSIEAQIEGMKDNVIDTRTAKILKERIELTGTDTKSLLFYVESEFNRHVECVDDLTVEEWYKVSNILSKKEQQIEKAKRSK